MRRTLTALTLLAALTGCAGPTPAEQAYLAERREASSLIDIDEGDELDRGQFICDVLAATKPEDRYTASGQLMQSGYPAPEILAARDHLCPETEVRPTWEQ